MILIQPCPYGLQKRPLDKFKIALKGRKWAKIRRSLRGPGLKPGRSPEDEKMGVGMSVYKDSEQIEAERVGYGPEHPPYFLTAFLVFVKRDRLTGGPVDTSYQCVCLDEALRKAREQMRVERVATRWDVVAACREIISKAEADLLAEEVSSRVARVLNAEDEKAKKVLQDLLKSRAGVVGGSSHATH